MKPPTYPPYGQPKPYDATRFNLIRDICAMFMGSLLLYCLYKIMQPQPQVHDFQHDVLTGAHYSSSSGETLNGREVLPAQAQPYYRGY